MKPTLILNERDLVDLRLLENTKVTLQTVNKVDNITISKSYEDVKLNDDEEYEIEFQVPPNIAEINVTVSTTVNVRHIISLILYYRLSLRVRRRTLVRAIASLSTTIPMTTTSVRHS